MAAQLYFEDVEVGDSIPALIKEPTTRQLVQFAGGSGDFYEIHYDQEFARSTGLADIIVHGKLKAAFMVQMVTDWIGEQGTLRKYSVRYRETDPARQQIICGGKVTAKERRNEDNWVECDIWTQSPKGQQTTTGTATFTLPSRK